MKNVLVYASLITLLASCDGEKDLTHPRMGKWQLIRVCGGITGECASEESNKLEIEITRNQIIETTDNEVNNIYTYSVLSLKNYDDKTEYIIQTELANLPTQQDTSTWRMEVTRNTLEIQRGSVLLNYKK